MARTLVHRPNVGDLAGSPPAHVLTPKKSKPVNIFATIGALCIAFQVYVYGAWILSDNFKSTPKGADPVPGHINFFVHAWQVVSIPAMLVFLYFFLYKQWRKAGKLTTDGMFCLAFLSVYWQDPLTDWLTPYFTYNSAAFNRGSWLANIPGWPMPHANLVPEPLLYMAPIYVFLVFGLVIPVNAIMRQAQRRWSNITTVGLVAVAFSCFFLIDAILEPIMMAMGLWFYPGPIPGLTLWKGHYFQYPLYEGLLWGGLWTAWACLRFFKNDKGQTLAERGAETLKFSEKRRTGIRLLSVIGACNAVFLFGYNMPMQFFAVQQDTWAKTFENRSYARNGLCGEGTDYACWAPEVPIPIKASRHVAPDGELSR